MDLWLLFEVKKVFLKLIYSHKWVETATFGNKSV